MKQKIIKFTKRQNLKYPLLYLIYSLIRNIEVDLIDEYLDFNDSLIFTPLMLAGEFVSGLIVFLYQKRFVKKTLFKVENQDKYMNIELI